MRNHRERDEVLISIAWVAAVIVLVALACLFVGLTIHVFRLLFADVSVILADPVLRTLLSIAIATLSVSIPLFSVAIILYAFPDLETSVRKIIVAFKSKTEPERRKELGAALSSSLGIGVALASFAISAEFYPDLAQRIAITLALSMLSFFLPLANAAGGPRFLIGLSVALFSVLAGISIFLSVVVAGGILRMANEVTIGTGILAFAFVAFVALPLAAHGYSIWVRWKG